ncbi:MAG: OpgC domain-containing protein [Pseudomonadota bacterium]
MAQIPRQENAVDFWRGCALMMIFINHIPGNILEALTLKNFAFADAAEVFVFLAGWSIAYASRVKGEPAAAVFLISRFWLRAVTLYRAQLVILILALAMLAAAAVFGDRPILFGWHGAGPAFLNTPEALVGAVLLTYQLGYFNILPMYIVLLILAPFMVMLGRRSLPALIAVSVGLYLLVQVTQISLPSWPTRGAWFFNPLSWQIYMVLGFIGAELVRGSEQARQLFARAWLPAVVICVIYAVLTVLRIFPDPMAVPEPRLLFIASKTTSTPLRLINLLALVIAFAPLFALLKAHLGAVGSYACRLGRNSLAVFCVGSLLSLGGQLMRFFTGGDVILEVCYIAAGLFVLGAVAWLEESPPKPLARARQAGQPSGLAAPVPPPASASLSRSS